MSLTGQTLPILLAVVAVAAFAALVLGWPRRRTVWGQRLGRAATAVILNLAVLMFAAVQLNDQYAFYVSWGDLLGATSPVTTAHHGATAAQAAKAKPKGNGLHGVRSSKLELKLAGRLVSYTVTGARSGSRGQVMVYLPAGYDPASMRTYPVLMALHGFPGTPLSLVRGIHLLDNVDKAVADHRMAAPIVVIPQIDNPPTLDTECVNVPGGHQVETWLSSDVPTWVVQHFRVSTNRLDWGVFGYSYGGWCAAVLGIRHPDVFGASIIMQGYFHPDFGPDYEPFWPGSALWKQYDLVKLALHNPPPVSLWILASKQDSLSYPSTAALVRNARAPLSITAVLLKSGGHRASIWVPKIPASLIWLGRTLPGFAPPPLGRGTLRVGAARGTTGRSLPGTRL